MDSDDSDDSGLRENGGDGGRRENGGDGAWGVDSGGVDGELREGGGDGAAEGDPGERDGESRADSAGGGGESDEPVRLVSRPLGQAPLLDSEPLPATRPGMLRPRVAQERPADDRGSADGFSLPVQRPAFDLGSGSPADIA